MRKMKKVLKNLKMKKLKRGPTKTQRKMKMMMKKKRKTMIKRMRMTNTKNSSLNLNLATPAVATLIMSSREKNSSGKKELNGSRTCLSKLRKTVSPKPGFPGSKLNSNSSST